MLPPKQGTSPAQRELLALFRRMDERGRESLLDFARFLAARGSSAGEPAAEQAMQKPLGLPRLEQETVAAAIRRLSQNYPMLNKDELFHKASSLMTAHVMQGRAAAEVIDELEEFFAESYRKHLEGGQWE